VPVRHGTETLGALTGRWVLGAPEAERAMTIMTMAAAVAAPFKDTTLVLIIGLFDLLGMVQSALSDAAWLGFALEGYVFAACCFWIFCFGMSRYSMRIERKLDTGKR
jgi:ABC-type amino acid transport system permease subunit